MCFDKYVLVASAGWAWLLSTFLYWQELDRAAETGRWTTYVLSGLTFLSYVQACVTPAGAVPETWKTSPLAGDQSGAPLTGGRRRWCAKCAIWKPARTHHCSICKTCVLRYDHHCPWIGNCVGFCNYKFFLLLVAYNTALFWTLLAVGWHTFRDAVFVPYHTPLRADLSKVSKLAVHNFITAYAVTAILALMFTMFACHHAKLAAANTTTVEELERSGHQYDLGCVSNLRSSLGRWMILWPLPIGRKSPEDGTQFPRNELPPLPPPPEKHDVRISLTHDILAEVLPLQEHYAGKPPRLPPTHTAEREPPLMRKGSTMTAYTLARSSSCGSERLGVLGETQAGNNLRSYGTNSTQVSTEWLAAAGSGVGSGMGGTVSAHLEAPPAPSRKRRSGVRRSGGIGDPDCIAVGLQRSVSEDSESPKAIPTHHVIDVAC